MAAEVPFETVLNPDELNFADSSGKIDSADEDLANLDVKQRLSSIVHNRRGNNASAENTKVSNVSCKEPVHGEHSRSNLGQDLKDEKDLQQPQSSQTGGSFMAGSLVLSNSILDEVLNEKKMALLQSPEVARFLQEMQRRS